MQPTTLVLVRHAATWANLQKPYRLQGKALDDPLSDIGERQAAAVAAALRDWPVTAIVASPLRRAQQTAQAIAADRSVTIQTESEVREIDVGDWEALNWEQIAARWPVEFQQFQTEPDRFGYPGGEDLTQLRDRILPAIETWLQQAAGETLILVGHNMVNRVALCHWLGVPLRHARQIPQYNAGYSVIRFRPNKIRVETINRVDHLSDELLPSD